VDTNSLASPSQSVNAEPDGPYTWQEWQKDFCISRKQFGNLPTSLAIICECCGTMVLDKDGTYYSHLELFGRLPFAESAEAHGKVEDQWYGRVGYTNGGNKLMNQPGIYVGEELPAAKLIEIVGIPEDSPFLELTDEQGAIHSLAWKDE
jgi:hypothetical protein